MNIIQIVAIGLVSAILALTIKKQNPEIAIAISIAAGVIIFMMAVGKLGSVLETIRDIAQNTGISMAYIDIVVKIIGIAYISEFGIQICKDAGESAIASKIEFGGKVLIMLLSAPILLSLMELILTLFPV